MWVSPIHNQHSKKSLTTKARQLITIISSIVNDNSNKSRSAKTELALQLFPDELTTIQNAISNYSTTNA